MVHHLEFSTLQISQGKSHSVGRYVKFPAKATMGQMGDWKRGSGREAENSKCGGPGRGFPSLYSKAGFVGSFCKHGIIRTTVMRLVGCFTYVVSLFSE